jgi:hypothetical protein
VQNRRNFGKLALTSVFALSTSRSLAQTNVSSEPHRKQSDYIFFASEQDKAAARQAAEVVLGQLDNSRLDGSRLSIIYQQSAKALKNRYTESDFANRLMATRTPLGTAKVRALEGVDGGFKRLPNLADGEYLIVIFDTVFQGAADIYTEQVTLARDRDAGVEWRLVEYFTGMKPYYEY